MSRTFAAMVVCCVFLVLGLMPDTAGGQVPTYLILQAPAAPARHHAPRYSPGVAYGVTTPTYAYGWFGVRPKRHWSRSFGYSRNYTQWKLR